MLELIQNYNNNSNKFYLHSRFRFMRHFFFLVPSLYHSSGPAASGQCGILLSTVTDEGLSRSPLRGNRSLGSTEESLVRNVTKHVNKSAAANLDGFNASFMPSDSSPCRSSHILLFSIIQRLHPKRWEVGALFAPYLNSIKSESQLT